MRSELGETVVAGPRGFPALDAYRRIKLVVFDVDGVLTDGRIIMDANGLETKFFHVRDGTGLTLLRKGGLEVAFLTGRSSPVVDKRARDLHIRPECVRQGARVKLPVFNELLRELRVAPEEAAFVGDDVIDAPVLECAGLACCPRDAHPSIARLCHVIATQDGGHGGVRQICEHLLQQRGDGTWEKALERYLGAI